MPVEDRNPGLFYKLDNTADAGGVTPHRLVVHRGRRRNALTADVLEELGPVWVVAGRQPVSRALAFVVADLLEVSAEHFRGGITNLHDLRRGNRGGAVDDFHRWDILESAEVDELVERDDAFPFVTGRDVTRGAEHRSPASSA